MERIIIFLLLLISVSLQAAEDVVYVDEDEQIITEKGSKPSSSKIVILNNQKVNQKALPVQNSKISNQPVVRVTGVPITKTHATELAKSRKDAEIQTEQMLVERLERSRLKDEQERLNKILKPHQSKSVVANNSATLQMEKELVSEEDLDDGDEIFVGLYVGQASNLTNRIEESHGSFGISAGSSDESGLILEGGVFYSQHEVSKDGLDMYYNNINNHWLSPFSDVSQLTGALSLKFTPFSKRFRPYVGVSVFYNLWMYDNDEDIGLSYHFCPRSVSIFNRNRCSLDKRTTNSIDLGANIGVDVRVTKKISLGFNLLINIVNFYNNNTDVFSRYHLYHGDMFYNYHEPVIDVVNLEETNWLIASINAKMYF